MEISSNEEKVFTPKEIVEDAKSCEMSDTTTTASSSLTNFPALSAFQHDNEVQFRRVRVPMNRRAPLRKAWKELCEPVVEHMKLQIRMNPKRGQVELRVSFRVATTPTAHTPHPPSKSSKSKLYRLVWFFH